MKQVELFQGHARRLRDKARRARRLAAAVTGDVHDRLLALAERFETRSAVAERCAEQARRRTATEGRTRSSR